MRLLILFFSGLLLNLSCSPTVPINQKEIKNVDRILSDLISDTISTDSVPGNINQIVSDFERTVILYYQDDNHILDDMYNNAIDHSMEIYKEFVRIFNGLKKNINTVIINNIKFKILYSKNAAKLINDSDSEIVIEYTDKGISKYKERFNNPHTEKSLDGSIVNDIKSDTVERQVSVHYNDDGSLIEKVYSTLNTIQIDNFQISDTPTRRQYKYYSSKSDSNKFYIKISENFGIKETKKFLVISNNNLQLVLHCSIVKEELLANRYSVVSSVDGTIKSYETLGNLTNNSTTILNGTYNYSYNTEGNLSHIVRILDNSTVSSKIFRYYKRDGKLFKYEIYNNDANNATLYLAIEVPE